MTAKRLTPVAIEALKPHPTARREVPDGGCVGLYVVVQPTGSKGFAVRYRFDGSPRKMTLGAWPGMSLAQARAAAMDALSKVKAGCDPGADKVAVAAQVKRDSVGALVNAYTVRKLDGLRSGAEVRAVFNRHVLPLWADRPITEIRRRDIVELMDAAVARGHIVTANRIRAHLSAFFAWCVERDILPASPIVGVRPAGREVPRDRVLTDDELRWLWRACDVVGEPWAQLVRVLILTGQRAGEVCGMTDAEVAGRTWSLPAARVKNGRAHTVHLSEPAAAALATLHRVSACPFLFTTTGRGPVSLTSKKRDDFAAAMVQIATVERGEPMKIPPWTWHDLRRTCATGLQRLGVRIEVTEAVLNHVSGTRAGIVGVYQRATYTAEAAAALDAWGRHVLALVEGATANVVQLRGRHA